MLRPSVMVQVGVLVIYMIIVADVLSGAGSGSQHHMGILEELGGGSFWWNTRPMVLVATAVLVIAPLVIFEKISENSTHSHTSAVFQTRFGALRAHCMPELEP